MQRAHTRRYAQGGRPLRGDEGAGWDLVPTAHAPALGERLEDLQVVLDAPLAAQQARTQCSAKRSPRASSAIGVVLVLVPAPARPRARHVAACGRPKKWGRVVVAGTARLHDAVLQQALAVAVRAAAALVNGVARVPATDKAAAPRCSVVGTTPSRRARCPTGALHRSLHRARTVVPTSAVELCTAQNALARGVGVCVCGRERHVRRAGSGAIM